MSDNDLERKQEERPVNEASVLLLRQAEARYRAEVQELANMAFRVDGVSGKDGWVIDLAAMVYRK